VLDQSEFNPDLSPEQLNQQLEQIKANNEKLKQANNQIKARLAALKA